MNRRRLLQIIAGLPLANGLLQRTFAAGQMYSPDISPASDRSGVAVRGELEATRSRPRGTPHQGAFAARRLRRRNT